MNLAAASPFLKGLGEWFDTNQFRQMPIGTAGNEPRNFLFSPSLTKVDFSIFKEFQIKESVKLQFRTEVFNIFNTPGFAAPVAGMSGWVTGPGSATSCAASGTPATASCVPSPANQFGQINATSAAYAPRDFQFALKLVF